MKDKSCGRYVGSPAKDKNKNGASDKTKSQTTLQNYNQVDDIKVQRFNWAEQDTLELKNLSSTSAMGQMIGSRSRGRPRTRWLDNVSKDSLESTDLKKQWLSSLGKSRK